MWRKSHGLGATTMVGGWLLLCGGEAACQSVATRTPNLVGTWTAAPGVVQFNFLHRFSMTDPPARKVLNTPTFNVGTGLVNGLMVGFVYGPNSTLVPAYPNEWEFYARGLPLSQDRGAPLDLSLQAGYNVASESLDSELQLARTVGRLRVLGAARAFSAAYDSSAFRWAVSGGAVVRLSQSVSVGGDWGVLVDRAADEHPTWGAGLQLGVPYTPHSLSLQVSNVGTASLEGASRGTRTRWGFEYTVPISVGRYLPFGADGGDQAQASGAQLPAAMAMPGADTVVVEIRNFAYGTAEVTVRPGTTVVWVNRDQVQHSVTADDGAFDSGLVNPGERFGLTFTEPGGHAYHCTPHPFMRARVVVEVAAGRSNR